MQITPYPKNAKKHPDKQLKQIAKSIQEFGWQQPIVVDKDGVIIVGHGRFMAFNKYKEKLSLPEPEIKVAKLTEDQAKAYRLADNKIGESKWDMDLVIEELKNLDEEMIDLTGFDVDLTIEEEDKDDDVPELKLSVTAELGDMYQLGNHRIMCGDSTKAEDVMKLMDGKKADMALTDPPYNVNYEGGTGLKIENDNMNDIAFCEFLTDAFTRMSEVMKPGAAFYIWHADSEGYNFRKACKNAGLLVRQCIIWNKNTLVLGRQDYQWKHEPCLYGWKEGAAHTWHGARDKTTVYKVPEDEEEAFKWFKRAMKRQNKKDTSVIDHDKPAKNGEHPTMKPVGLLFKQIINSSKQEHLVLDTFLGSGSTLIACEKTSRKCYGMELDPKYIDVIIKRWENYTENKAVKLN